MDRYTKGKVLGKGSFGCAILATHKPDGKNYVIKEIDISRMPKAEKEASEQEAKLLMSLNHPNIVRCKECFTHQSKLCIVMEWCSEGDLHCIMQKRGGQALPEDTVLDWFVQMCLGLKHVHDRKILHRDIKTQNVFVSAGGLLKLGDFGVSKILNSTWQLAATAIGTPYYLSPEICQNRKYNHKSDIWSLGCVLYELLTMKHAFEGPNMRALLQKIIKGSYTPVPPSRSRELREVVDRMLVTDAQRRPSINDILAMPVVKARIAKFLTATLRADEFSHTTIHGKPPPGKLVVEIGEEATAANGNATPAQPSRLSGAPPSGGGIIRVSNAVAAVAGAQVARLSGAGPTPVSKPLGAAPTPARLSAPAAAPLRPAVAPAAAAAPVPLPRRILSANPAAAARPSPAVAAMPSPAAAKLPRGALSPPPESPALAVNKLPRAEAVAAAAAAGQQAHVVGAPKEVQQAHDDILRAAVARRDAERDALARCQDEDAGKAAAAAAAVAARGAAQQHMEQERRRLDEERQRLFQVEQQRAAAAIAAQRKLDEQRAQQRRAAEELQRQQQQIQQQAAALQEQRRRSLEEAAARRAAEVERQRAAAVEEQRRQDREREKQVARARQQQEQERYRQEYAARQREVQMNRQRAEDERYGRRASADRDAAQPQRELAAAVPMEARAPRKRWSPPRASEWPEYEAGRPEQGRQEAPSKAEQSKQAADLTDQQRRQVWEENRAAAERNRRALRAAQQGGLAEFLGVEAEPPEPPLPAAAPVAADERRDRRTVSPPTAANGPGGAASAWQQQQQQVSAVAPPPRPSPSRSPSQRSAVDAFPAQPSSPPHQQAPLPPRSGGRATRSQDGSDQMQQRPCAAANDGETDTGDESPLERRRRRQEEERLQKERELLNFQRAHWAEMQAACQQNRLKLIQDIHGAKASTATPQPPTAAAAPAPAPATSDDDPGLREADADAMEYAAMLKDMQDVYAQDPAAAEAPFAAEDSAESLDSAPHPALEGRFMLGAEEIQLPVRADDSLACKIEALRLFLEERLGTAPFLRVYSLLESLSAADSQARVEEELVQVLGVDRFPYVHLVRQLILCEENMHAQVADSR